MGKTVIKQVFEELGETGKAFVKEVKQNAKEGVELGVKSLAGLPIEVDQSGQNKPKLEEIRKKDNQRKGPEIIKHRQFLRQLQNEPQKESNQPKGPETLSKPSANKALPPPMLQARKPVSGAQFIFGRPKKKGFGMVQPPQIEQKDIGKG